MHHTPRSRRTQRGNILFLILLAVVLFAALNYAVTNSMRGGGKDASAESAELAAAEILQWFSAVDTAVMRMHVVDGVAYEDISFGYSEGKTYAGASISNYQHNTRCTSNRCRIFHAEGGGVRPPNFVKYATPEPTGITGPNLAPGFMVTYAMNWPQAGTSSNDVVLTLFYMSPDVCNAMNDLMNIDSAPVLSGTSGQAHIIENWDASTHVVFSGADQLAGKDTFARSFVGTGAGLYCHIYHLAFER